MANPHLNALNGKDISVDGTLIEPRRGVVNLIAGTGVTLSGADNSSAQRTDVTINASGGSGSAIVDYKDSARLATTADHPLSGLTAVDSVTPNVGDRVVVRAQTLPAENGIYVAASGAWTRATDFDADAEVTPGAQVYVEEGTTYGTHAFRVTNTGTITVGVTGITWTDIGAVSVPTSRTLTAGAGLTGGGDLSADRTFDVVANADGSIVVNANDVQVGVLASDAQHGTRGGGTQHAAAVANVSAGFISAVDQSKLDNLNQSDSNPQPLGTADPGIQAGLSRVDHVHAHGDQAGGTLHSVAVASGAAGFLSGTDKAKLDGISSGAAALGTATPQALGTADDGTATAASKEDHVHPYTDRLAAGTVQVALTDSSGTAIEAPPDNASGNGTTVESRGGSSTGSNGNGGDRWLRPGAKNGSGTDGTVGIRNAAGAQRFAVNPSTDAAEVGDVSGDIPLYTDNESAVFSDLTSEPGNAPTDDMRVYTFGGSLLAKDDTGTVYVLAEPVS